MQKLRPYASVHHINHCTFPYKHVKKFLVSTISITTHFLCKHVKIASHFPSVHHINHYTFPIQTCKKFPSVHHINHYANKPKLLPSHTFLTQPCIASTSLVNRSLHCIFLMLICQIEVIS